MPLLVCLTHADKLYAEVKGEVGIAPNEKEMKKKFQVSCSCALLRVYLYGCTRNTSCCHHEPK